MIRDRIFTLLQIYENNADTLILLDETLLTISKKPEYVQKLVESLTDHFYYSVEVIPTTAEKMQYTPSEVQKEFDTSFRFDTHMYIVVTMSMIKNLSL